MLKQQTNQTTVPKLALTREEAAQAVGVHPITISRLTRDGKLRPSRATRRPLYSIEEIQRFLRDTATPPIKK
jgi:predicted urease superfamily metal-dependent hydrolase